MEDLFKKTMNYFNTGSVDDDFVGQIVEVGAMKLKIIRKIAEGKKIDKKKFLSFTYIPHKIMQFETIEGYMKRI